MFTNTRIPRNKYLYFYVEVIYMLGCSFILKGSILLYLPTWFYFLSIGWVQENVIFEK